MRRIFHLENPFWNFVSKLVDVIWLNLIFIIFSIPIITIGASTTAMYSVTLKMVRDREGYMFQGFWRSFKANFKQATVIWMGILLVGTILGVDIYFFYNNTSLLSKIGMSLTFGVILILLCALLYIFPLLAQFDNAIKQTLKNALLMAVKHLPWTILLLFIHAVVLLGMFLMMELLGFFIFGLTAFLTSYIYTKIFIRYIPEDKRNDY